MELKLHLWLESTLGNTHSSPLISPSPFHHWVLAFHHLPWFISFCQCMISPHNVRFRRTAPPSFLSLTIYSRLVITLRKSQSGGCVMHRWVPMEVFLEMGLYKDWSCLRFPCTKTAIHSVSSLQGPFVLGIMYSVSWWLVIPQRCAIMESVEELCVCVSV